MTNDDGQTTASRGDVRSRRFFSPSSFVAGLPVVAAGALLGLFLARFWYELDPVRFSPFGDWPGAIGLAVVAVAFLMAQWRIALRHLLPPDAILPVHIPFALLLLYLLWPEVDLRLAAVLLLASAGLALALGLRAFQTSPPPQLRHFSPSPPEKKGIRGGAEVRTLHRLAPIALAVIVFAVYARTLGTHVGKADTFEFQVVAPTLGIAHPTGYPLYVLIGRLFSLLPIGSTALRVNLTSAVFATAASVAVYALIAGLGRRRLVAFVAALAFAVSYVVWSQAVVAEVYALNALIAALVIGLLVDLMSNALDTDTPYIIGALFLLLGLGISHHLTTILLLPAFGLAILIARPRMPIRSTMIALGLFALGLAAWFYIPLRWPALHGGAPMTAAEFVDWITGAQFGGALVLGAWSDPIRWSIVARLLLDAFGPFGAILAAIGLVRLALKHRRAALSTFVTFAGYVFYGLVYLVPDVSVFLIPAYLIQAVWIGIGVTAVVDVIATRMASSKRLVYPISLTFFLMLPVILFARNFSVVDQRGAGAKSEAWGRYVLDLPIPEGAAILVDSEKIAPLYYLQVTESLRPDLDILVLGTEQEYRQQLDARLARGQPVYLARFLPNLPYAMRSLGPLVEVSNRRISDSTGEALATFGDVIELADLSREEGDPFRLTLTWRALTDARSNYHVRLRLIDANGRVWWEDLGAHPAGGYYPTGAWAKGEVVADYHEVELDPAFPPGEYTLQVGLFPPFRDEGLLTGSGEMWWSVVPLIAPQVAAPLLDHTVRQTFDGKIVVSGVDSIGVMPQSSVGRVRLNWMRAGDIGEQEIRVSLSIVDATERLVWSNVVEPYKGLLRVKEWSTGVLQTVLDFHTPDRDGDYALRLAFVDESGSQLSAQCGWLAPLSVACPVGSVRVEGGAIGDAINFDDQVLLTDWTIDRAEMQPGETIHVQLSWRGLRKWENDYTVTVQLIGPDGKLYGQVDAWPGQGTLPTSTWAAGQTVVDPYAVVLQPGAPKGQYQIQVGWYLLATLRRLPVLDAAGRPADDRIIIGGFRVP